MTEYRSFQEWARTLQAIPEKEWDGFGAHENLYLDREWWNVKFYPGGEGVGDIPRINKHGSDEIPYGRRMAYPSKGRFAPGQKDVSWWARDHGVATCETNPKFRADPPKDGAEYFRRLTALPAEPISQYGYPEPRKILTPARFLDLTRFDQGFLFACEKNGIFSSGSDLFSFLKSRGDGAYPASWAIADAAMRHGFKGVIYCSSWAPAGMFDHLLASFDDSLMVWPYEAVPSELSRETTR